MTLLELFVWWTVTFTPFIPIPRNAECVNPQCDAIRFTIRADGQRFKVVWNEATVIAEVQDSLRDCKPVETEL